MENSLFKDPKYSIKERVENLLSLMTVDEKVAQIHGTWQGAKQFLDEEMNFLPHVCSEILPHGVGQLGRIFEGLSAQKMAKKYNEVQRHFVENTRLGIPVLFHTECLRGLMEVNAIAFPHPIALAGSFRTDLVEKAFSYAAEDARSRGALLAMTPVLDVARDSRWGRTEETFGEDPYLISQMGIAAVKGFQGDVSEKLQPNKVMATLKHFAAHGQPEGGTNCAPANYSERIIREVFLYPFQQVIKHANPLCIMPSYNEIDGVPSHANKWLLQNVLRGEFGFTGFVVSDYYAVEQLEERHHVAANAEDAAILALKAGVDIELPEQNMYASIPSLLKSGKLSISVIDEAVSRLLYFKFFSGLFDNPYVNEEHAKAISESKQAQKLSYQIAVESAVLLKNENAILPLQKANQKIAVIGPNADYDSIGGYACPNENYVTILEGLQAEFGDNIVYAKGCGITTDEGSWFVDEVERTNEDDDRKLIQEAVEVASTVEVIVLCIGGNQQTSREAWKEDHLGDRASLNMVGLQQELFDELYKLGKPIIVVLSHGRPLSIPEIAEKAHAILDCWYLGQETGHAVTALLTGKQNPSGKLSISVPRSVGHLPIFYNKKPTAKRGYLFEDTAPLYAFGYGLSYTDFEFSNLRTSETDISKPVICTVNVDIKNKGKVNGSEVVQLYIRDVVSSVTRPVKELKKFNKVYLQAGEIKTVTFELLKEDFAFYDINMDYTTEPGEFIIMVGNSSRDEDLMSQSIVL